LGQKVGTIFGVEIYFFGQLSDLKIFALHLKKAGGNKVEFFCELFCAAFYFFLSSEDLATHLQTSSRAPRHADRNFLDGRLAPPPSPPT
jgi:hypothetical protein